MEASAAQSSRCSRLSAGGKDKGTCTRRLHRKNRRPVREGGRSSGFSKREALNLYASSSGKSSKGLSNDPSGTGTGWESSSSSCSCLSVIFGCLASPGKTTRREEKRTEEDENHALLCLVLKEPLRVVPAFTRHKNMCLHSYERD